jgi:sigma-B regulation protein RsbU (phosphoserine phosphatase)
MAVTKTLLKGMAELSLSPAEILERVNTELCRENDSMMFVTVFCGILNFKTGQLIYSNAGHEPPLLLRRGGSPSWVELPPGLVLGVDEDSRYETRELYLQAQDTVLTYTDGVTEAIDTEQQLFSSDRLRSVAERIPVSSAEQMVHEVMGAVNEYSSGAQQADDITIMAVRFKGPRPSIR